MNRRKALKLLGALVVMTGGTAIIKAEEKPVPELDMEDSGSLVYSDWMISKPLDYHIEAEGIGNIVIIKQDGENITIPFTKIIKALED